MTYMLECDQNNHLMVKTNYKQHVATLTDVIFFLTSDIIRISKLRVSITEKAVLNQGWQVRIRGELKLFSIKVGESGKYAK